VIERFRSTVRLSKDQGGSPDLLDTPLVDCVFNRRQYNFLIGPIPVWYAQADAYIRMETAPSRALRAFALACATDPLVVVMAFLFF
jgi:hypothetical protein